MANREVCVILPLVTSVFRNTVNTLILALCLVSSFDGAASESASCIEAKKIYEKNRQEQRKGYKLSRGNWLNCIEGQANDAKRKYCRLKKVNDNSFPSVKTEIEQGCKDKGIKRYRK